MDPEGNAAVEKTAVGIGLLVTVTVEKAAAIGGLLVAEGNAETEVVAADVATSGGLILATVDENLAGGSNSCGAALLTSLVDTKVLVAVVSWV